MRKKQKLSQKMGEFFFQNWRFFQNGRFFSTWEIFQNKRFFPNREIFFQNRRFISKREIFFNIGDFSKCEIFQNRRFFQSRIYFCYTIFSLELAARVGRVILARMRFGSAVAAASTLPPLYLPTTLSLFTQC